LARALRLRADFRSEVYARYEGGLPVPAAAILERAIAEAADLNGVLVLVRNYAKHGRLFDGVLQSAIRHVAVGERPSTNWAGASEVFGLPIPELRKALFAMMDDAAGSTLASACLNAIDDLRDDYGVVETEPRHPDIDSGRPWPLPESVLDYRPIAT